ncbi:hypothetical protein [Mangrovimonas sp. ST2L15]|uniref:hypothetical protein n=1 Tax=Mangrovimonas sp. ST2L15 TaxID=1645916 RepID=UPI0006B5667A|nr:hypothetical protein [Mangrovimonas sp. ST2L15]
MRRLVVCFFSVFFSCSTSIKDSQEYKELEKENMELKSIIKELKNTPESRYIIAEKLYQDGQRNEALNRYKEINSKFTGTEYAIKSSERINEINNLIEKERDEKIKLQKAQELEEKRKRELGFKLVKSNSSIKLDDLTLKFSDIGLKGSFTFDSYGDTYHYRKADRGSRFITAKVSITSKSNDPNLPTIIGYIMKDGKLTSVTPIGLSYRFRRWEDYGSYLGNDADYGNDFSKTSTIPFNLGYEINNDKINGEKIYLVLCKNRTVTRKYDRFDNPPISYNGYSGFKISLNVDDFDENGDYILIKIING